MTFIIIAITVLVTIAAFNNSSLLFKLIMYPYEMRNRPAEYYRLITSGFIHADWNHLIFNMLTLFFFGRFVEDILSQVVGSSSLLIYLLFYLSAVALSSLPALVKHSNDSRYRSLGASGGVSAILFFTIYYFPWNKIMFMFIPFGIPAILYGILYTIYSAYMSKKGMDNIGHDAHLSGGIYGFIIAFLTDPTHGQLFLEQMRHPQLM